MFEFLGIIFIIILFIFFPHTVGSLALGYILGGMWWIIFVPFSIYGLLVDIYKLIIIEQYINHKD